jgi:hypothetical protein
VGGLCRRERPGQAVDRLGRGIQSTSVRGGNAIFSGSGCSSSEAVEVVEGAASPSAAPAFVVCGEWAGSAGVALTVFTDPPLALFGAESVRGEFERDGADADCLGSPFL